MRGVTWLDVVVGGLVPLVAGPYLAYEAARLTGNGAVALLAGPGICSVVAFVWFGYRSPESGCSPAILACVLALIGIFIAVVLFAHCIDCDTAG